MAEEHLIGHQDVNSVDGMTLDLEALEEEAAEVALWIEAEEGVFEAQCEKNKAILEPSGK